MFTPLISARRHLSLDVSPSAYHLGLRLRHFSDVLLSISVKP